MNWLFITLAYASLFGYGLADNARGPVFPDLLRDYGLSNAAGSMFFLVSSLFGLLNNLFASRWLPGLGPYRGLIAYSLVQAAGTCLMGMGSHYLVTLAGAALFGTSMGGLSIIHNVLVAKGATAARLRQAYSGLHCMYGMASLLAPLAVSGLYGLGLGWRATIGAMGIVPVLAAAAAWRLEPAELPSVQKAPASATGAKSRAYWVAAIMSLYVACEIMLATRLALLVRRDWGYSAADANGLLTGFFALLFAGRFLFAVRPFRLASRRLLLTSAFCSALTFLLGLAVHPGFLVLTGLAMSIFYPVTLGLIGEEYGEESDAVTSLTLTVSPCVTMVMHFLVGWLADLAGVTWALALGPLGLAAIVALFASAPPWDGGAGARGESV